MNWNALVAFRRWLLWCAAALVMLACFGGFGALVATAQGPTDSQVNRVQQACESVGILDEKLLPGYCAGGYSGTKFSKAFRGVGDEGTLDHGWVVVDVYESREDLLSCLQQVMANIEAEQYYCGHHITATWGELLPKPANVSLGTEWAYLVAAPYKARSEQYEEDCAGGGADLYFTCGTVAVAIHDERAVHQSFRKGTEANATSAQITEEVVKPRVLDLARKLVGALQERDACSGTQELAVPGEVYSTPKDRAHYLYETPLPKLLLQRADAPTLAWWFVGPCYVNRETGELEIVFTYQDRQGAWHEKSFRRPLAKMIPCSGQWEEQWAQEGETFLKGSNVLHVGYKDLDALQAIVSDRNNANPQLASGETWDGNVLWGSKLTFRWQVKLYDDKGLAAASVPDENSQLVYTVRYPVVFVPGTGGSRLGLRGGAEIWPAYIRGSMSPGDRQYWSRLAIDDAGQGQNIVATDIFRYYISCGRLSREGCIYQGWLEHMTEKGMRENELLFLYPFDWRLGTDDYGKELDKLVDRALARNYNRRAAQAGDTTGTSYAREAADKVILVTHSLGGLVARAYVADQGRAQKVQTLIQLGTPNQGTPKAAKAVWTTGYAFEAKFLDIGVAKWIARNWPGAYEQFPVTAAGDLDRFLVDAEGKLIADTRQELLNTQTSVLCSAGKVDHLDACAPSTLNPKVLDAALALRKAIPAQVSVPTYIIASYDQPTIVGYRRATRRASFAKDKLPADLKGSIPRSLLMGKQSFANDTILQDSYPIVEETKTSYIVQVPFYEEIYQSCGDNLVPLDRLTTLQGASVIYVRGVPHGGYTEDATVQQHIDRLLSGVKPDGLPKPTCNSQPTQQTNAIQIRASSPANLHVYDSQGRHTGPTQGGAEQQIPGSQYEAYGAAQQVILPFSTQPMRIVLEGTQDALLDVQILSGDGLSERRAEWVGISETAQMRAEIQFAPGELGANTILKLDLAGDGRAVQEVLPHDMQSGQALPITPTLTAAPVRVAVTVPAKAPAATVTATATARRRGPTGCLGVLLGLALAAVALAGVGLIVVLVLVLRRRAKPR